MCYACKVKYFSKMTLEFGLLMRYKKSYIYILFFILLIISPFHRVFNSPQKTYGHAHRVFHTSVEERRIIDYAYMGYKYINKLTKKISNESNPLLIYKNWGYGVTTLLSDLRLKTNRNIIITIGLDRKLPNSISNTLSCNDSFIFDDTYEVTKSCSFKKPIYITGIILDKELEKNEVIKISFISNKKIINTFKINKDNLLFSPKISSYKIPYGNTKLYEVIDYKKLDDGNLQIVINSKKKLNFSLTGFYQNSEPGYKINDHYILNWNKEDARSYLAIDKAVLTNNLKFKNKDTCVMLFEIFKSISDHNPLGDYNDCL